MTQKYLSLKTLLGCLCAVMLITCKTPYDPTLKSSDTNALVVEGNIDGSVPVIIKLSRSRMLTNGDTASRKYETGAKVRVEDDHQNTYTLYEGGNGIYSSITQLPLNPAYHYRLHIFTSNGQEYASDFVPFKSSPPIDSLGWNLKDGGVQVYVNTHDPDNATTYYRWEYSQTWEFHTFYYSVYQYDPTDISVVPRTIPVQVCWQTDSSTSIFLGSSAKLSGDVIYQMPLPYIPDHDQKLSVLYSILVKQYALDADGYNYWLAMKNNTENVGSIFDPQPNESVGNIHCISNPAELVVGYVSAGNSVEKRIFISNSSLPSDWNQYSNCIEKTVPNIKDSLRIYFGEEGYVPIADGYPPTVPPTSYTASSAECVDCTLHGTLVKPTFWP